jgi:membrane fusion protein (multidrug efflux system)
MTFGLLRRYPVLVAAFACVASYGANAAYAQEAAGTPPPPEVTVIEVEAGKVPLTYEYAARVAASREVQVRAQVGGILLKRDFNEGAAVEAGDVLFEIDPKPYEAELAKARAQQQQAEAQLAQANRDVDRTSRLAASGSGTQLAKDDALSARDLARAAVAIAEAEVQMAELNLGYTKVTAPISGVTSLEQVPEGSLIGTSGDSGLLTRITQRDPVYINFSVSESELAEVRALLEAQGVWDHADDVVSVEIMFGDGHLYPLSGAIDFTSSGLDPETGTLRIRAVVENPERRLLPGQFVRAIVTGIVMNDAIVVPHAAVSQGPQGQFVYTVDSDGNAEIRPVELGREIKTGWIVRSGLAPGDRLITEGIIKVRPGAPVTADATP